jgi:F-type H+-transporting ATPase subunit delta
MADSSIVARPYAKALFDLASAERKLPAWSAALGVAAAVVADEHAKRVLARPSLTEAQRVELVASLVAAVPGGELLGSGEGLNLLKLLAENDRLSALPEIAAQFDVLKAEAENKVKVTLVAASAVDAELTQQITKALAQRFGRAVELGVEVDASLIGGAIVRAEDMVIDGSVRTRLQRLTETLVG